MILCLFLLAGLAWALLSSLSPRGGYVRVTVDGEQVVLYPLDEDREVLLSGIGGTNLLQIEDGKASVTEADCPDKICVRSAAISRRGQTIVCLPHRLVVEVLGTGEEELDGISR